MNKITGGAFALLSAFVLLTSGSAAQAQGFMDSLKGITNDPTVDNFLRNKFPAYSSISPNGYSAYGAGANGYGLPYQNSNGGLLGSVSNMVAQRGLGSGYLPGMNQNLNGYGYSNNYIDPNLMYNTAYGNGNVNYNNLPANWDGQYNLASGNRRHHHKRHGGGGGGGCGRNGNTARFNGTGADAYFNQGGAQNSFYSLQNGAALGGIGYDPYTLGR